jgi:hypothetical protein
MWRGLLPLFWTVFIYPLPFSQSYFATGFLLQNWV